MRGEASKVTSTAVVTSDVYSVPEVAGDAAVLRAPTISTHVDAVERLLEIETEQ